MVKHIQTVRLFLPTIFLSVWPFCAAGSLRIELKLISIDFKIIRKPEI